jgi:hypothetical protein
LIEAETDDEAIQKAQKEITNEDVDPWLADRRVALSSRLIEALNRGGRSFADWRAFIPDARQSASLHRPA